MDKYELKPIIRQKVNNSSVSSGSGTNNQGIFRIKKLNGQPEIGLMVQGDHIF